MTFLVSLLEDDAYRWWRSIAESVKDEELNYDFFCEEFRKNFMGQVYINKRSMNFLHLKQMEKSVLDYEMEFVKLSKYGPKIIPNARRSVGKFVRGLLGKSKGPCLILILKIFTD